jgi:hypothetical protein
MTMAEHHLCPGVLRSEGLYPSSRTYCLPPLYLDTLGHMSTPATKGHDAESATPDHEAAVRR